MSADEMEKTDSLSHDDININGVAMQDTDSGGRMGVFTDKSSSLKNVAIWVRLSIWHSKSRLQRFYSYILIKD